MSAGYSFRPRAWALVLGAAACAAGVALGLWQSGRAAEKRAAAAEPEKRRVSLRGTFRPEYTVFLDNKIRRHRAGYEVVTPLRLGSEHVLVNRGWIEAGRTRESLPQVRTPAGEVRIEGTQFERFPRVSAKHRHRRVRRADRPQAAAARDRAGFGGRRRPAARVAARGRRRRKA
jgi:surfeit locus 1 family protein